MAGEGEEARGSPMTGIVLKVASVTAFVVMFAFIKAAGAVPAGQIVFFRSAFAILPVLAWYAMRGQLNGVMQTERPMSHLKRGLLGVISMGLGFFAITRLPLPDAIMLNYANPLLVVVFSALFAGEIVRAFRWTAVVIGLIGVVIISWPKLALFSDPGAMGQQQALGVVAALGAAAMAAAAMVQVRGLVKTEKTPTIVLYFSVVSTITGLLTWPLGWESLTGMQMALLVISGFCGGIGQILLTQSYRMAEMSVIAPFEYSSMILSVVIGWSVFGDIPTTWTLVGGAIVVLSGLMIIWREHRLGLERAAARKVQPQQG